MIHLHVRSAFTLLSSTLTISKIVALTKQNGFHSVALCDHHVMHGAMAFYHACKNAGIKAIFGMEVDVKMEDVDLTFLLLAKNDEGYQNLMRLSTYLNTDHHTLSFDELLPYCTSCIVILAGENSSFETYVINEEKESLMKVLEICKQSFQDFYTAISRNDSGLLKIKNRYLKNICKEMGIATCALSRIYYGNKEDEESYKILRAIDQGVTLQDKTLNYSPNRYYRSAAEMEALYDEDDLKMCDVIGNMCNVEMKFPKAMLPVFENKFQVDSEEYLKQLCHKGLQKRMNYQPIPEVYAKRLQFELDIITNMHYSDYFLIVWDFIRYAKTQGIFVGPGRGSAAGSLVAYCLGITHVDPIHYELVFERFLNPERVSMPDIDTDFPDNRRDEVIRYVRERYGSHRVAHIVTFNTLAAKQVMRDVGKAMGINPHDLDTLCRMVPFMPHVTLDYTYENVPRFKQMLHSNPQLVKMFEVSRKLEGLPRHASQHAAGIVIAHDDITSVCPLIDVDEGVCATQFTMEYLEELGLIKMDFLGLRNLTIIDEIVNDINSDRETKFDIMRIPFDDKKTFELLQKVDTIGIFQLESEGMKNLIRKMQLQNFEDIVAAIALFRPGPMENIPAYLERRQDPKKIDYIHPNLKPILSHTYGIMIYQEQIMQIAQLMAGFSLAKADNLRKAISKKHGEELQELQKEFIEGSIKHGYTRELAMHVYELIMKFANYGFNRSHSVAYGVVAYQMAYLKANAPLYFYRSLLNSVIGSESKTSEYVFEAKRRGIEVMLPSVSRSTNRYEMEGNALRFPFTAIKGIGASVCMEIQKERDKGGPYPDFFDFAARMMTCRVNKKTIETLIYAGALDEFKINRASLLASLDDALRYGELVKIEDVNQITIDFDLVSKPALHSLHENKAIRAQREKDVIGFYLSEHPIMELRRKVDTNLDPLIFLHGKRGWVKFLCHVDKTRQHRTKNGDLMLFATVSDESSSFDLVCMPNIYQQHMQNIVKGNYLLAEGKIDREGSCLVKKLTKIEAETDTSI